MTIGQRIKNRRELLNIGQTELADKVHVSKQTLYKYENDIVTNIPSDKIQSIAAALDTTPSYLMGWEDFVDEVAAGQHTPDEIDRALEMLERYRKATPKVQSVVDLLLSSENSEALLESNQQDS